MTEGEDTAAARAAAAADASRPAAAAASPEALSTIAVNAPEILDALDAAISIWDSTLHCVWANRAGAAMQERPREALVGAAVRDVIGAERLQALAPHIAAVLRGERVRFETRRMRRGRPLLTRVEGLPCRLPDGRIDGVIEVTTDITEERAARDALEALAASEARLRALADALPVGVYEADAQARNTYTNARWQQITGLTLEQSLGDGWRGLVHPDDREAVFGKWLTTAAVVGEFEMATRIVRADGALRHVVGRARALRGAGGAITGYVGTIEDVTALLDRTTQLRRERKARRRLERLADELARLAGERRDMLDLLAHEVRQPLNNASAAIESAGAMLADGSEPVAAARLVHAQGVLAEVQRHVDNTLALSTLLAGAPAAPEEEADIDTVVAVALAELPRSERARVTVRRQTAARTALMDSALVRLALRNLLGNAVRHTAPATPVTVRISDHEAPLALFIDIIDEGDGLPAPLLAHLFERGARVQHRDGRNSHGLGLFIAHRALKAQGGDLRLLYTGATGTALRLVLPQGPAL